MRLASLWEDISSSREVDVLVAEEIDGDSREDTSFADGDDRWEESDARFMKDKVRAADAKIDDWMWRTGRISDSVLA